MRPGKKLALEKKKVGARKRKRGKGRA